jgi:multicomponent Na+:H+ antiporter subunit F
MDNFYTAVALFLIINASLCLYRAFKGPTVLDRILAINIIGTKTIIVLVLIAYIFHQAMYVDVALVYGLLNFIISMAAARYIESGKIKGGWERDS